MISPEEFIALLEEKDLVAPELVEHLRQQIARPSSRVSAALLAKWLVDRGHLSRLLAQRLLDKAVEEAAAQPKPGEEMGWEKKAKQEEEELGLAPLDDEITGMPAPGKREPKPAEPVKRAPLPSEGRPAAKPRKKQPASARGKADRRAAAPVGMGPLDTLMDDAGLTASAAPAPLGPVGMRKRRLFGLSRRRGRRRENVWDSPLLLVGGGTLLALVILGGVLFWALRGRGADELLQMADEDYRAGSYTQAIAKYNDYLEDYSDRPEASLARVRCGLAQLRQATDYSTDWPKSLKAATDVLAEIAQEEAFKGEAQPELVAMLPKIAEKLAGQAHDERSAALVQEAEKAVALVNKYVRPASRPVTKLADIDALLALTKREIARGEELERAVLAMNRAVEAENTGEAYQIRAALLKQYPSLIDDPKLREAVLRVSEAEKVTNVEERKAAGTAEPSAPMLASLAFAPRTTNATPPGTEGHVIYAVAQGAAYGLDAASGKVLWRRRVGFAGNGQSLSFPPTAIAQKPGSDAIMVDAQRDEVLRVEAATGRPRWQHAIGEPFDAHPVVAGDFLLVATRSGRLVRIDLDSGDSPGYIQFPQALRVAPRVDFARSSIYQVAEHSNLFVLSLTDGEPKQVVYLGHEPGSVAVPPVAVNRYLIVAENDGVKHSTLRVLSLESEGEDAPPVQLLQSLRLQGHVDAPPQVSGVRVLVATDQGELYVFEVSATDSENPLAPVAESRASAEQDGAGQKGPEGLIRFPLFRGPQVWIADNQLTRYDLQLSKGQLQPKAVQNERSATLQPLVAIGQTVFHVRRRTGLPGVLVSAVGPDESEPLWEIHLAAPLAAKPTVDARAGQITAVTAIGAIFQVETGSLEGQSVADQPTVALKPAELRGPVEHVVQLQDGVLAIAVGDAPQQLSIFDPKESQRFRLLYLPDTTLSGRPLAFAGGLVAPCAVGQALLLDPRSGNPRSEPFQPALQSGAGVAWSEPVLINENEFLLAEARTGLYRIGIKDQPRPHLAALARVDLAERLTSPLAVVGQVAYAVDAAESLLAFGLPDLTPAKPEPLGARNAWGPRRVGDYVLLATEDDQLRCLDADQKRVWQVPLPYGPLAGDPVEIDGSYVLAAAGGVIWRVEAATGNELSKIETGYPLATGPVQLGEQLLVGGDDGSLYKVRMP